MNMPTIRTATADELDRVLQTATIAFCADPVMRWIFPGADAYLRTYPGLMAAFCGASVSNGTAYVSEDFGGVALWFAPGVESDDEAMGTLMVERLTPQRLGEVAELLTQMATYHPDDETCWYLPVIGVDAFHQGKGLGSALMKHATRMLDETSSPAYLESSNPLNISLYQRHGFEVMGEIRIEGAPVVTPMFRQSR